jgi:hypothetical protein
MIILTAFASLLALFWLAMHRDHVAEHKERDDIRDLTEGQSH